MNDEKTPSGYENATRKALLQRYYRKRNEGKVKSTVLRFQEFQKLTLAKLAYRVLFYMWRFQVRDDLKAPFHNPAKSAMVQAKAAFNAMYCGVNIRDNNDGTVVRAAYGFGSDIQSIGLNPATMRLLPLTPVQVRLIDLCVDMAVQKRPDLEHDLRVKYRPNALVTKAYFTTRSGDKRVMKECGWHADVTRTHQGKPLKNNSQVPGSHVLIVTFGDPKNFWMAKHKGGTSDRDTLLHFLQRHCTMTILHGSDKKHDEDGKVWKHMSNMRSSEGITFALTMRCVQMEAIVNQDGTIPHPTISPTLQQRLEAAESVFQTEEYKQERQELEERMMDFFRRYKP